MMTDKKTRTSQLIPRLGSFQLQHISHWKTLHNKENKLDASTFLV